MLFEQTEPGVFFFPGHLLHGYAGKGQANSETICRKPTLNLFVGLLLAIALEDRARFFGEFPCSPVSNSSIAQETDAQGAWRRDV